MALKMAELESSLGINSTYYFRHTRNIFAPKIIKQISENGHQIGYHYEVLSKTNGNYEEAIELFKSELGDFRKICNIDTICMHGSVLSKYDNKELWKRYDFRNFDLIGEAYLSMGTDFGYFSDTGWEWNTKHKLRDLMSFDMEDIFAYSTDDLYDIITNKNIRNLYILAHPGNWAKNFWDWNYLFMKNTIFNNGKKFLRRINNYETR